jgi:hypothetical protein
MSVNQEYANNASRILEQLGNAQSRGSLIQGANLSGYLQDLGQTIALAPERALRQKQIEAQTADLQSLAEERKFQQQQRTQQMQESQKGQAALVQALNDPANIDPETGKIDHRKVSAAVSRVSPGLGEAYLGNAIKYEKDWNDLSAEDDKQRQRATDVLSRTLQGVETPEQADAVLALNAAHGSRIVDGQTADQIQQQIRQGGPQALETIKKHLYSLSTEGQADTKAKQAEAHKITVVPAGAGVMEGTNQIVAPSPKEPTPKAPPAVGTFEDYVTRTYGDNPTPPQVLEARKAYGQADDKAPRINVAGNAKDAQDIKDVVESVKGMADGSIPPILPSRASREYTALMAEAHRQGVNLVKLNEDWNATQKYLSTLNGQQQVRLRQAVAFTKESLPLVEDLAKQWDAGRFPLLNKANLALAKNGAFGQGAASIATKLDAQISDLTSELGTVYKGGNSSTDESLALAAKNLSSNWSKQTLLDNVTQIRKNLAIRENSIRQGAPISNDNNQYAPKASTPAVRRYNPATGKVE